MKKLFVIALPALVFLPIFLAKSLLLPVNREPLSPDAYLGKIAIENLFAGRGTAGEQHGLPLVWFRLRNMGTRTVEEVRVHVSFFDRHGKVVHEAEFLPVHRGVYGIRVPPLGPGDIWQMSAIRYFMPKGVPHTWDVGAVEARIMSVRLAEG